MEATSLRQEKLSKLKEDVHAKNPIKTIIKHFVSLPSKAAHGGHPTGWSSDAVFNQKLHPKVTSKITEVVHSGITETAEVKLSLKYYIDSILSKELGQKPAIYDRAFYPLNSDIRNHVCMAKKAPLIWPKKSLTKNQWMYIKRLIQTHSFTFGHTRWQQILRLIH